MKTKPPESLYYITHIDNLPSILKHGVLSHEQADKIPNIKRIYDEKIVHSRQAMQTPDGKSLWQFANFYFNPRNPMLYRVFNCEGAPVVIIKMKTDIYERAKYISIGNAASPISDIVEVGRGLKTLKSKTMQKFLCADSWGMQEGKRLIMAELLVPDVVPPECIDTVYVPNDDTLKEAEKFFSPVVKDRRMFFLHGSETPLSGTQIKLIKGDMFFSRRQTLTISVNTVGVMGAGLASRAKYNFPNLYVYFQELCRAKKLTTRRPFLYKEQYSYDEHMADEPESLKHKPNDEKWFLLFATKQHWRNPSKLEYIEDGFKWLLDNAKKEGIKSLAMPALGCGLGGLPWSSVGPVMCSNLHTLNIPCEVYLPNESDIPAEQLTADFLLRHK